MAGKPKPSQAQPGQRRQHGTAVFCSNYNLDSRLYREDAPYRVYEYQRIPPLINRVPVKIRRTHMGMGVKSRFSSHKAPKNSHLAPGEIKLRTEDLCSIRGELSQIKAQVDSLLESLEHMDQQRNKPAGHAPPGIKDSEETHGAEGSTCRATEPQQEPRAQRAPPEHNSGEGTNVEETVKNHTRDWEGSQ